ADSRRHGRRNSSIDSQHASGPRSETFRNQSATGSRVEISSESYRAVRSCRDVSDGICSVTSNIERFDVRAAVNDDLHSQRRVEENLVITGATVNHDAERLARIEPPRRDDF